jgi:hypothetical protein
MISLYNRLAKLLNVKRSELKWLIGFWVCDVLLVFNTKLGLRTFMVYGLIVLLLLCAYKMRYWAIRRELVKND